MHHIQTVCFIAYHDTYYPVVMDNPSLSNMGEGFINWGYSVVGRSAKRDIKRLYSLLRPACLIIYGTYRA